MQLDFVGTGAADYLQALTCSCPICREARQLAGRNLRTFSSLLIDGSLLIDCGPTAAWRLAEMHVRPEAIGHLLITHAHSDHLDPESLRSLTRGRAAAGLEPLQVWGNEATMRKLASVDGPLEAHEVHAGDELDLGTWQVLALPARHDWANQNSLTYVVSNGGTSVLYATDTAWPEDLWWQLIDGRHLTGAVIESTFGPLDSDGHPDCLTHHLNWATLCCLSSELRDKGLLTDGAPVYATHLSQHFVPIHDRFVEQACYPGLSVGYDGLSVELS